MTPYAKIRSVVGEIDGRKFAIITASLGGSVIGCVEVSLANEAAQLAKLYVQPEHRRYGVGTDLFTQAKLLAKNYGKVSLAWTVKKDSAAAFLFYTKRGAIRAYDDGDEWIFCVPLTPNEAALPASSSSDPFASGAIAGMHEIMAAKAQQKGPKTK